jgi:hypothetical protein
MASWIRQGARSGRGQHFEFHVAFVKRAQRSRSQMEGGGAAADEHTESRRFFIAHAITSRFLDSRGAGIGGRTG